MRALAAQGLTALSGHEASELRRCLHGRLEWPVDRPFPQCPGREVFFLPAEQLAELPAEDVSPTAGEQATGCAVVQLWDALKGEPVEFRRKLCEECPRNNGTWQEAGPLLRAAERHIAMVDAGLSVSAERYSEREIEAILVVAAELVRLSDDEDRRDTVRTRRRDPEIPASSSRGERAPVGGRVTPHAVAHAHSGERSDRRATTEDAMSPNAMHTSPTSGNRVQQAAPKRAPETTRYDTPQRPVGAAAPARGATEYRETHVVREHHRHEVVVRLEGPGNASPVEAVIDASREGRIEIIHDPARGGYRLQGRA